MKRLLLLLLVFLVSFSYSVHNARTNDPIEVVGNASGSMSFNLYEPVDVASLDLENMPNVFFPAFPHFPELQTPWSVEVTPRVSELPPFPPGESKLVTIKLDISVSPPDGEVASDFDTNYNLSRAKDKIESQYKVSLELAKVEVEPREPRSFDANLSANWSVALENNAEGFIHFYGRDLAPPIEGRYIELPSDIVVSLEVEKVPVSFMTHLGDTNVLISLIGLIVTLVIAIIGFIWNWKDRNASQRKKPKLDWQANRNKRRRF